MGRRRWIVHGSNRLACAAVVVLASCGGSSVPSVVGTGTTASTLPEVSTPSSVVDASGFCRAIDRELIRGHFGGEVAAPVSEGSRCVVRTSTAVGSLVLEPFVGEGAVAALRASLDSDASVATHPPQGERSGPAPDEFARGETGVWLVGDTYALAVTTTGCCMPGQAEMLRKVAYNTIGSVLVSPASAAPGRPIVRSVRDACFEVAISSSSLSSCLLPGVSYWMVNGELLVVARSTLVFTDGSTEPPTRDGLAVARLGLRTVVDGAPTTCDPRGLALAVAASSTAASRPWMPVRCSYADGRPVAAVIEYSPGPGTSAAVFLARIDGQWKNVGESTEPGSPTCGRLVGTAQAVCRSLGFNDE